MLTLLSTPPKNLKIGWVIRSRPVIYLDNTLTQAYENHKDISDVLLDAYMNNVEMNKETKK